ncbi:MAG: hypothetical protein QOD80_1654, partial [Verrucomicrobiota bacterium]
NENAALRDAFHATEASRIRRRPGNGLSVTFV